MARRVRRYQSVGTVETFLDSTDIEAVKDEIVQWAESLESANMEHMPKYEEVDTARNLLEQVDMMSLDELKAVLPDQLKAIELSSVVIVGASKHLSRNSRLAIECAQLHAALNEVQKQLDDDDIIMEDLDGENLKQDIGSWVDEAMNAIEEIETAECPAMF